MPLGRDCQLSSTVFTKTRTLSQTLQKRVGQCSYSKTVLNMRDNGTNKLIIVTGVVIKFGQTEASTRGTGRTTRPTEEEDSYMPMAIFTMVTGKMTKHMDSVNILILTELSTRGIGLTTNNMEKVKNIGLMARNMKEIISMEKKMDLGLSFGPINPLTKVILLTIIFMGMELINGQTTENTLVIG